MFGKKKKNEAEKDAAIKQWEQTCAAMDLAEREAAARDKDFADSCPIATLYWLQNVGAVSTEVPMRWSYHLACCCACTGLSFATCHKAEPVWQCAQHHAGTQQMYCWLRGIMFDNIRAPCTSANSWYVYKADVRLKRPPPPPGVSVPANGRGGSSCCECTCNNCQPQITCTCDPTDCIRDCLEDLEHLLNREIRSMLCCFSCVASLHPARCLGPAPCYESTDDRHMRWEEEAEAAMLARTEAFYKAYDPNQLMYRRSYSRGLVARRETQKKASYDQGGVGGGVGTAQTVAPVAQTMTDDRA